MAGIFLTTKRIKYHHQECGSVSPERGLQVTETKDESEDQSCMYWSGGCYAEVSGVSGYCGGRVQLDAAPGSQSLGQSCVEGKRSNTPPSKQTDQPSPIKARPPGYAIINRQDLINKFNLAPNLLTFPKSTPFTLDHNIKKRTFAGSVPLCVRPTCDTFPMISYFAIKQNAIGELVSRIN